MNWKSTWFLVFVSTTTLVYIALFERSSIQKPEQPQLIQFKPDQVASIQLRRTNEFVLRTERTDDTWKLVSPAIYPAQGIAIDQLLVALSTATAITHIPLDEIGDQNRTIADFGLDFPIADLTLELKDSSRIQLFFGNKTAIGDNVYLQLANTSGIYVVPSVLFDRLPLSQVHWRDPRLMDLASLKLDHMDVRIPGGGYEIRIDSTNNLYILSKPSFARADFPKTQKLLSDIQSAQVARFVTDDPSVELEPFGLATPKLEVGFGYGTNDSVVIQFGNSPTNMPDFVFARRLTQTNIVLVLKSVLDALAISPNDLRDHNILVFSPAAVRIIEVEGNEPFSVHRSENGQWLVQATPSYAGDPELVTRWILNLANLEGEIEKDVVTEFAPYGLAAPAFRYILMTAVTNATGDVTNKILDQLDIGAIDTEKVLVRRATENTVFSIPRSIFDQLPTASWKLRERQVWSFTTNDLKSVTLSNGDTVRKLIRSESTGSWSFAPGSNGAINPEAANETLYHLGQLRAELWVERGAEKRNIYGITDGSLKVEFEIDRAGKTQTASIQFGGIEENHSPYALANIDEQSWILEIPLELFVKVRLTLFPSNSPK